MEGDVLMSKTIIVPLLGFVFLALSLVFKIDLSEDLKKQITDFVEYGVALGAVLYGIFKSHHKKK